MARQRIDYLTPTQERILTHIRDSITTCGESPTLTEIGDRAGMRSRSTVHWHLGRMEALGYIARERGRARGIRLA